MSASICVTPHARPRQEPLRESRELSCTTRRCLAAGRITAREMPARPAARSRLQPAWSPRGHAREHAALLHAIRIEQAGPHSPAPALLLRISDALPIGDLLIQTVAGLLAETGFPASRLQLEFSETALQPEQPELVFALATLRDLGVTPVLAGFGGGVSSLSLLRRRSLTGLLGAVRLDAALLREFDVYAGDIDYLRGLVQASHALGLIVLADGIDTPWQLDRLLAVACDEGSGLLFDKAGADHMVDGHARGSPAERRPGMMAG